MLQPKRTKFRKAFKGRIHGVSKGGFTLSFGQFGLKAMEPERITARQIEAARRAMTRHMKRAGRVWIRIFPDVPVSKKPTEVRMGKGKGSPELWVAVVKPGRVMFEIEGVPKEIAQKALGLAAAVAVRVAVLVDVLADGMKVRIKGTLDYYAPFGKLSLKMSDIDPRFTLGELALQRDELLAPDVGDAHNSFQEPERFLQAGGRRGDKEDGQDRPVDAGGRQPSALARRRGVLRRPRRHGPRQNDAARGHR
mgnify:CR=1 FL=1